MDIVIVVYFILGRLLYLAFSANLGLQDIPGLHLQRTQLSTARHGWVTYFIRNTYKGVLLSK